MSEIKVNKISPRTNCGTTTLGDSGDTFTIPSGVSITNQGTASGFGSTGEVSWNTTVKTGDFTATSGEGYFINTTSGEITVTLPSATAGSVVAIQDYNNTFDSNKCTITAPSGVKINGGEAAGSLNLETEGQGLTLIYVDSTVGWRSVDSTTFSSTSVIPAYITATVSGSCNTLTTVDTNYKVATFVNPGTFCISAGSGPLSKLDYLVIAGGAGGSRGGGGAGGFRESHSSPVSGPYTASPLASSTPLGPFSPGGIPVSVGAGGAAICAGPPHPVGNSGVNSSFSTITSAGGGGGGGYDSGSSPTPQTQGVDGGSGGGGGAYNSPSNTAAAGSGNTPPTSPAQGKNGGLGSYDAPSHTSGGGGGGAGAVGAASPGGGGVAPTSAGGAGGAGVTTNINGSPVQRAGGGGGSTNTPGSGGAGGAGGGGAGTNPSGSVGNGTASTGGGGGGIGTTATAGAGGSGLVIIRYRFQ